MVIVWRLRGNIIRTAVFWIVWHNVRSPQHTYMSSSYRSNRLGLSYWDSYAVYRGGCLELYYCNTVKWFWRSWRPVKIVPEMTYNVLSGMLILYTTTTEPQFCTLHCSQLGMIGNCPLISFSNFHKKYTDKLVCELVVQFFLQISQLNIKNWCMSVTISSFLYNKVCYYNVTPSLGPKSKQRLLWLNYCSRFMLNCIFSLS